MVLMLKPPNNNNCTKGYKLSLWKEAYTSRQQKILTQTTSLFEKNIYSCNNILSDSRSISDIACLASLQTVYYTALPSIRESYE